MAFPNTFATRTGAIPTQDLDENFDALSAATGSSLVGFTAETPAGSPTIVPTQRTVQSKLRDTIDVRDFGAVGNGSDNDTAEIQAAMNAAADAGLPLQFPGGTFCISATTAYALTAPASLTILGVQGSTTIKILSASVDTTMIGRSTSSTYFRCEGITFDGNKSVISARNVSALYFPEATTVISRNNTFKDLNDLGSFVSKCIYVDNSTLAQYAESTGDVWTGCEGYPFQTYKTVVNLVQDARAKDILISFTDINGQTIPSNVNVKTTIRSNQIVCDSSFDTVYSVLSVMGNDIECTGKQDHGWWHTDFVP